MLKEQKIINTIVDAGVRVASYPENCKALFNEVKDGNWDANGSKQITPFVHTNVVCNSNQNAGTITASATIFYPFVFKIPSGTTKTEALLDIANAHADEIEEKIKNIEHNLEGVFTDVTKQGQSAFDLNFSEKYFSQKDKAMFANFFIFAYVCNYNLLCDL